MSKTRQLALPLETHRNHYLFSDHFLNELLPGRDVWRESTAEARQALDGIAELYSRLENALPHYNEAQAEEHWIRPVLDILDHTYEVQPPLAGALGTPDYAFFTGQEARQAATPTLGEAAYWETVLAVGDAKRWDRPLDKRLLNGAPDAFTNANPCYQIDYYLRRTGCAWGIVSNGRRWRLYHQDTSFRLDIFYEVDLVQLIEQEDLAAFRYFYLFFRAATFRPDAEGRCWLDEVLSQSKAYAVHVGDELKERVYGALRLLAQGFLDYPVDDPEQALDPATDLPRIHDACLILLYRLLFLLYAESRELLPLKNPSYAGQYSLKAIKEEIARKLDEGVIYLAEKATLWDALRTLFDIIYNGQEALGVPAYDGRLFDPARYPFLAEHTIGDRYLAQAIDLLARAEAGQGQGLSFVDYRDLSIRHLGSIYEGLLEYRLAHADDEMAVARRGKRGKQEEIIPASEVDEGKDKVMERITAGQVCLVTDRGERKATGSYYTPDYIVKYIVEQTLGPLADAQAEAVEKEIAALKVKNKGAARRTKAYKEELTRLQNSFADRVLALNTLDPAMGSGHFLVEATDYLARRIVEAGVVTEALVNGDEESELNYWRRRVVERCIYGVDLNPLAMELAKLSLWLATVARGKPLSFLDHHLRCGNSLIGARVADLQALPVRKKRRKKEAKAQQLAMWDEAAFSQDMYRVVGAMRQIQEYETADLVSVKEKERLFEETVERERRKWRSIADLWTATYFGLELTPELYNACVQYTQGKPVLLQAAQAEALLAQAHEIWEDKHFFHWEIEFPEVFFDEYGRHKGDAAGFDAVVGNPPYVNANELNKILSDFEKPFWKTCFESAKGAYDLYVLFIERGLQLAAEGCLVGLITPNKYLAAPYAIALRDYLLDNHTLELLYDISRVAVFEDASIYPVVSVIRRSLAEKAMHIVTVEQVKDLGLQPEVHCHRSDLLSALPDNIWGFLLSDGAPLASKINLISDSLGCVCEVCASTTTGEADDYTQALVERTTAQASGSPIVNTGLIDRYSTSWGLEQLTHKGAQFYEPVLLLDSTVVSDTRAAQYKTPKIIFAKMALVVEAMIDTIGEFASINTNFAFQKDYDLRYVGAICNSSLMSWVYGEFFGPLRMGGGYLQFQAPQLRALPIRRIAFTTPLEERERLVKEGLEHYEAYLEHGEDVLVRAFVFARLLAEDEPEQADVIHDLLAYLAERMIEMHKEKQAEVRGFLDWLAEYTGRPTDEWVLKTNLRRYYEHDWAEMQRILKRNQRKLPNVDLNVDGYRNEPAANVRAAWETSMDTLRPLLARIEATDGLIDQIVYQLYGLTEEEIAVVEGRCS